jgi:hypothetical protein
VHTIPRQEQGKYAGKGPGSDQRSLLDNELRQ